MAEISFEKALEKLETIVEELETGDLTLDVSLKKYEEGIVLARKCHEKLDKAKAKVELLIKKEGKGFDTETFDNPDD
ncbi:MAG: exodeoxyribonuclease VII small subunit [Candidatus Omnitrophota bacterium]